jgi:hypothetical protein
MDKLGFPLFLLATLWGLFTPALKVIEMTNNWRDKIVSPESKLDPDHKKLILYSDWLSLWAAMYIYAIALGVLTLFYPALVTLETVAANAVRPACIATGLVILASAAAGIVTGILGFMYMQRHLNDTARSNADVASARATSKTPEQSNG